MILGFVGTGKIASSVITGICKSNLKYKKIIISPRNKQIAQSLKKKFKKIVIAKNNQQIVDQSTWVFLSITPTVGDKIIKDLKFKSTQTVVSFISTITLSQLKKAIKVKARMLIIKLNTQYFQKIKMESQLFPILINFLNQKI